MLQQQNPATVTVKGSDARLFSDAACTVPLAPTSTLAFGDVRVETPSQTVTIYLKNTGTDPIRPKIQQSGLSAPLSLVETAKGTVATAPAFTLLYQPGSLAPDGMTHHIVMAGGLSASATTINYDAPSDTHAMPAVIKIDDELIIVNTQNVNGRALEGCQRGAHGTTAATHADGALITFGTYTPEVPLAAGSVLPIPLKVQADTGAVPGPLIPFNTVIVATSDY